MEASQVCKNIKSSEDGRTPSSEDLSLPSAAKLYPSKAGEKFRCIQRDEKLEIKKILSQSPIPFYCKIFLNLVVVK
ncbi:hypothetical protein [Nostoc sp.]|uniref:hypothetical protein n=1 Tax=Nostoc sp. TaxID=1180 RepID=UPI002FF6955A